ncbi:hypothetical protein GOFOIKOB_6291 [Methylobacterium tardum]|uniref:Uncharacterized protein n=1 Tax=Methylobacterium tardum TaxID=374432 RepID=A0AA37TRT4_9HYPH|nr:hypothetical protein [Methylobacterium tardum]URD40299.1 hypothetical protein M6G65_33160 [Methylobacterium tardum]GJE53215.1 hypothetical protein GOFOIKOB_6291 [Methylobacterium tardum]GLS74641.1 hypothetical protein GCM10007890_66590 [Methylobacterium tardum]
MIVRAADLPEALPLPAVPELSPRDQLGERYAADLLAAFRAIYETSSHVVAHLEANGDALVLLAQVQQFDAQVKAVGAALMGLGCVAACDGCA